MKWALKQPISRSQCCREAVSYNLHGLELDCEVGPGATHLPDHVAELRRDRQDRQRSGSWGLITPVARGCILLMRPSFPLVILPNFAPKFVLKSQRRIDINDKGMCDEEMVLKSWMPFIIETIRKEDVPRKTHQKKDNSKGKRAFSRCNL